MTSTLIQNASAMLTGGPEPQARTRATDLRIEGDRITEMGSLTPRAGETVIDARGCVVYPGFVNTHHHLFQSVLKGVPAGLNVPLFEWLQSVPYRYGPYLGEEAIEIAATIGIAELLLSGCTTVADHHYLYGTNMGYDPSATLFNVAERLGVRFVLLRGGATMGRSFATDERPPMPTQPLDVFLREVEHSTRQFHDASPHAMRKVVMAPTTPFYSCTPDELREMARAARSLGIRLHSHLSETADYVRFARDVLKSRPVDWCAEHEWIGPDVSFAHMVHLDAEEIAICGQTQTAIAHCPQSNGRLGSGVAPVQALAQAGATVSIGVDGAASNEAADMISELHAAWMIHRAVKGATAQSVETLVHWATANGAKVLGLDEVGTLAPGMQADLVLYDLTHPRYAGNHDDATAPITAGGAAQVRHAWVAGRTVVRDGQIPGLDLAELSARARALVKKIQAS
ncbi:amidohydrolase [Limnohabitans sp. JirII-29]|uniref:amidohydrolase family protein n=1 Tax=unclassified Limnohabitans TaxID=2626134 RepID=UPI000C1F2AF9|nr:MULTISPECIES: amidohydrolase family protein [unclassified Limnohabitans]PIT80541.1 amidohydrolase [Limnohabitans sp. JirII-31]PUE26200.1 amidohydrolase [Limnohabitans sp. JirII-29]